MTSAVKLSVVIHAEEEFDWDGGFYRSNHQVTHHNGLIAVVDQIIEHGGKVTLAMDYAFVTSAGGQKVVDYYRQQEGDNIEFATHLHPWVNPPYENEQNKIESRYSYPCNLEQEQEYQKLKYLTETIETITGVRPTTYLAGRYGIGDNTAKILKELGYSVDLSISAYVDFTHQQGPNFSQFTNRCFTQNDIQYFPHTGSVLSLLPPLTNYLNRNPELFTRIGENKLSSLVGKFLRIRRYRLSPEGFTFKQMKQVTESQMAVGQEEFILSFHSPSAKPGLTPYVNTQADLTEFRSQIAQYLSWFFTLENSCSLLPKQK
ncbi:hypothetical protein R3X26_00640 [Vibrio sp. TH_r3]|uniref:hypothetical protein n=1 Tax=Vibrio sp. TH_r3 TaxID=3082084 RepID=UPI002952AAE1|nr:hypothetical protein [Vibrio sp. TH_r3]MDV7102909.1 hypothetical protein [Vibrio sp. TH_r3]